MTDEQLLTIKDVAAYLKLNPRTVSNKAQQGVIPARKVAGRWRFDAQSIREYQDTIPKLNT
jgi:excisionase family DNA binding protein